MGWVEGSGICIATSSSGVNSPVAVTPMPSRQRSVERPQTCAASPERDAVTRTSEWKARTAPLLGVGIPRAGTEHGNRRARFRCTDYITPIRVGMVANCGRGNVLSAEPRREDRRNRPKNESAQTPVRVTALVEQPSPRSLLSFTLTAGPMDVNGTNRLPQRWLAGVARVDLPGVQHVSYFYERACDRMEEFLSNGGPEIRDMLAIEVFESLQNAESSSDSDSFARFLGPQTKRLWAELQAIWKTSVKLDLRDRTVLEGEVLMSRILRQLEQSDLSGLHS
jgi:hypothetical protein